MTRISWGGIVGPTTTTATDDPVLWQRYDGWAFFSEETQRRRLEHGRETTVLRLSGKELGGRMYLGWYDPDKKITAEMKIKQARQRYIERWGTEPTVVLVNANDVCEVEGLEVRVTRSVAPNTFFVGTDEPYIEGWELPEGRVV